MKPIIGITTNTYIDIQDQKYQGKIELPYNYAEQVTRYGGVPILLPESADPKRIFSILDGWLIPGCKEDIDPAIYGQQKHTKTVVGSLKRFQMEAELFRLLPKEIPILGICYGCQFLNIIHGGSLHQHLPDLYGHDTHSLGETYLSQILPETKLRNIIGKEKFQGKRYHHQAIDRIGKDLRVCAKAEDETIEAIESKTSPWLIGVQSHPERSPELAETQALFRDFIRAATEFCILKNKSLFSQES